MSDKSKPKKILFCSALDTTFIRDDYKILSSHFSLYKVISPGIKGLIKMLRYLSKVKLSFIWFASVHSGVIVFLSKLLDKKTIVSLGGFDVAKEKEIGYGIWNSWWRSLFVGYAIRNADYVFALSQGLKKSAINLAKCDSNHIEVLEFSYDDDFWHPVDIEKERFVLTVANIDCELRIKVKGIDQLIKVAKLMSDVRFKLVGVSTNFIDSLQKKVPPNMKLIPSVNHRKLLHFYQKAKVYCQPSRNDTLPITLREAMLCGCVPVGTDVGGIPEAIVDTGCLVEYGNTGDLVKAIKYALNTDDRVGINCRKRILEISTSNPRKKRLIEIVRKYIR